jgi:hypothetical protein
MIAHGLFRKPVPTFRGHALMRPVLILAALLLAVAPAAAQQQKRAAPVADALAALPRPPLCDPLNLIPGCRNADGSVNQKSSVQGNPFDTLADDVLKKILADVTYAKALAKAASNDVTLPCWTAWVDLVTSQTAPLKDDAGNALAMPDPHFFVAAERASQFINQIQPNSKLYIGCSAALNQSRMAIGQLISAVLSGGALGLFKLP